MEMASCILLFPLAFPLLLPFPLSGARTRILSSRLPALTMAFFPLLTSPPIFLPLLPWVRSGEGALAELPRATGSRPNFDTSCFCFQNLTCGSRKSVKTPTCDNGGVASRLLGRLAAVTSRKKNENFETTCGSRKMKKIWKN